MIDEPGRWDEFQSLDAGIEGTLHNRVDRAGIADSNIVVDVSRVTPDEVGILVYLGQSITADGFLQTMKNDQQVAVGVKMASEDADLGVVDLAALKLRRIGPDPRKGNRPLMHHFPFHVNQSDARTGSVLGSTGIKSISVECFSWNIEGVGGTRTHLMCKGSGDPFFDPRPGTHEPFTQRPGQRESKEHRRRAKEKAQEQQ